jgi:hypothetical protein
MEKVFVGILAGAIPADVVKAARAAVGFIYYAQFRSHTEQTLTAMETALQDFHKYKEVFVCLGIRKDFNIPKIHSLLHYATMIRLLGSADSYNTEASERLHIDYAKDAYRATNHKDYVKQITTWLRRQEVADQFTAYLDWRLKKGSGSENADATSTIPVYVAAAGGDQSRSAKTRPSLTIRIAKTPADRNISISKIVSEYCALHFLPALTSYLKSTAPAGFPIPSESLLPINRFNLYKQVQIGIRHLPAVADGTDDKICATTGVQSSSLKASSVARFDAALVKCEPEDSNMYTKGTVRTLEGLSRLGCLGCAIKA